MSDSTKEIPVHQETAEKGSPKKGAFKRHCGKFWWIYLIAFIIIVVLVVVLIIFVAIPKIAQKKLNEATLTIEGIRVTEPESGSFVMAINSTIYADDSVHATIEGFQGAMYLEDLEGHEPFAYINFPETKTESVQTVNVSQAVTIDDLDALTTFNTWLISNSTVRVTVEGDTNVHVKGISRSYGVTFKKTLEIPALDNFSGLEVLNSSVSLINDENGDNFKGWVNVPNHSIFSLEIGNASFSTTFEDEDVGVTRLDNMFLSPGNNTVWMHAAIDNVPITQALFEDPYCEDGIIPFALSGLNVTSDGQNLTWYGVALSQTVQNIDVDLGTPYQNDLNVTHQCTDSS